MNIIFGQIDNLEYYAAPKLEAPVQFSEIPRGKDIFKIITQ